MRHLYQLLLLIVVGTVLLLMGCGSSKLHKDATAAPAKQAETKAQAIVQQCASHGNFLSRGGRNSVLHCMAPPGQQAAFQRCAEGDLTKDGFLSRGQRQRLYQGLAVCVENHR